MTKFLLLILLVCGVTATAQAQDALKETSTAAKEIAEKAKAMQMDLDELQRRLVSATRKEREMFEQLQDIAARTKKLEQEQDSVANELKTRRESLAELLVALSRLGRLPPEVGLLRQENTRDAALASILLKSALPEVRADAKRLADALHDLDRVQKELQKERTSLAAARIDQERERADIEELIGARQKKLQLTTQEQAQITARLEKLRQESANVKELVGKVATPGGARTKFSTTAALALRGGMLQPVSGQLKRRFGEHDDSGTESQGLTFAVESSARIVAPARGRVMFAGPFRGYGQIVILEHESDIHSMISGFSRIDVSVGQKIAQGEPLGLASNGPGEKSDVYFELRDHGDPVDPRPRAR